MIDSPQNRTQYEHSVTISISEACSAPIKEVGVIGGSKLVGFLNSRGSGLFIGSYLYCICGPFRPLTGLTLTGAGNTYLC